MSEEFQAWREHFVNQAKGLIPHERKFYRVSKQEGKGKDPIIKMVTPTEQVVERAKASLSQPPSVYDPVTGVMQYTGNKHTPIKRKKTNPKKKAVKRVQSAKKKPQTKGKQKSQVKTKAKTKKPHTKTDTKNRKTKWWK